VDLNPIRAARVDSPDRAVHTSAYDRILGERGEQIPSAAFDLVTVSTEEVGRGLYCPCSPQQTQSIPCHAIP